MINTATNLYGNIGSPLLVPHPDKVSSLEQKINTRLVIGAKNLANGYYDLFIWAQPYADQIYCYLMATITDFWSR